MISTHARNLLLNWMMTAGAATRPTAWYVSLHVADPGKTGANELDIGTDADYVRKLAAFDTATVETSATTGDLTWTADVAATPYSVTHIGVWDALSGGNFLIGGALTVPESVVANGSLVLATGRCIASLT